MSVKNFKEIISQRFPVYTALFLIIWLCSYLGQLSYFFDLLSSFRLQMLYGASLLLFFNIIFRHRKSVIVCCIPFLFLSTNILYWLVPAEHEFELKDRFDIYYANVFTANQQYDLLLKQIKHRDPDVIGLVEINDAWAKALDSLNDYPYKKVVPRKDNFGLAIYSKYPMEQIEVKYFSKTKIPSIFCKLKVQNTEFPFLLTHPLPPVSKQGFISRNGHLENMAKFLGAFSKNVILVGDLNTTMWSPFYQQVFDHAKLYNARQGFGVKPSWPANFFTKIPIDHCLLSPNLQVMNYINEDSVNSDHHPITVKLLY